MANNERTDARAREWLDSGAPYVLLGYDPERGECVVLNRDTLLPVEMGLLEWELERLRAVVQQELAQRQAVLAGGPLVVPRLGGRPS